MPPIKLRSSAYSTFHDDPANQRSTSLFLPLGNHTPIDEQPLQHRRQRSLTTLPSQHPDSLETPPFRTLRSKTTGSRVQSYIQQSNARCPWMETVQDDNGSNIIPDPSSVTNEVCNRPPSNVSHRPQNLIDSHSNIVELRNKKEMPIMNLHDDIVEHLDVIDAHIATASSLANAANTIVVPPSPFYSRTPIVNFPPTSLLANTQDTESHRKSLYDDYLDRHVDDVLQRPSKLRRTMQGIWAFAKTPMGVVTIIYGFLVAFWGAAIVLFATKMINLRDQDKQGLWVEISSQIENGLFTITGIGFIPSRVMATYRISWILHYKRKESRLRAQKRLPKLIDEDDMIADSPSYVHVLTKEEENDFHKHQRQFQQHQTWYRPCGTQTHKAFPVHLALWICLLVDGNSIFQVMLCGTMWGLNRFQRPAWSTGILVSCSFLCGIFAAALIWWGGQKTRRVAEVEARLRKVLPPVDDGKTDETVGEPGQQTPSAGCQCTKVDRLATYPKDPSLSL